MTAAEISPFGLALPGRRARHGRSRRAVDPGWFQELFVRVAGSDPVVQGLVGGFLVTVLNIIGGWPSPSRR